MSDALLPTPFHARTAAQNSANAWVERSRFSVPAHYGDPEQEALAARVSAVVIDISAEQDLRLYGEGAKNLLAAACGPVVAAMPVGRQERVHWCADGGGVRGFGVLSRVGEEEFLLRAADVDLGWFSAAAPHFGAAITDVTQDRGLLFVGGPYALPLLAGARLEAALDAGEFTRTNWRGLAVTLSRSLVSGGYEISCAPEDAWIVFDRLARAARLVAARLAGENAWQLLQMEAGIPLMHADFAPAREPFAQTPSAAALGLHHSDMPPMVEEPVLTGVVCETDKPLSFARLFLNGMEVGRSLRSLYSPALQSAIVLAQIQARHATPGTRLTARYTDSSGPHEIQARIVPLPFL